MGQQSGERSDVLVVVADDIDKAAGGTPTQEVEVATGDLPALDIADPLQPEQLGLGGPQPCVRHPMTEDPPDDREEVEVTIVDRCGSPGEPVACDEEGPIEGAAVVRHDPGIRRDRGLERGQERAFLAVVRKEELDLPEAIGFPPPEPDEEGDGAGRGREPGRLRVEADERDAGRWLAGQGREPDAIDRHGTGRRLAADDDPLGRADDLAVQGVREPAGQIVAAHRRRSGRESPARRCAVPLEASSEGGGTVDHGRTVRWPLRRSAHPARPAGAASTHGHRHRAPVAGRCRPDSRPRSRTTR